MSLRNEAGALRFLGSFPGELPASELPEIAFAGRSNVGKSSALNCLLNSKKAARVSGRPGRTQAINLFQLGQAAVLADLPGYGFAKVPEEVRVAWKGMIEHYLVHRAGLRLVVVLVDARRDPQALDGQMLYALTEAGVPALVVATKVDKLKRNERQRHLAKIRKEFHLAAGQPIAFSAPHREGRDAVWDAIERACGAR